MKVKDRVLLGILAGLVGNTAKMVVDEVSLRLRVSQRSFRSTAAGVWVKTKKDADSPKGQLLGVLIDFSLGAVGGLAIVQILTKTGRDQVVAKGLISGITVGSTITALLSWFPTNKVSPKDSASNLSYMAAHAVYGVVTAVAASQLGHPSVFDAKPANNYIPPTELTTEQQRAENRKRPRSGRFQPVE